jgi:hypothetical protein
MAFTIGSDPEFELVTNYEDGTRTFINQQVFSMIPSHQVWNRTGVETDYHLLELRYGKGYKNADQFVTATKAHLSIFFNEVLKKQTSLPSRSRYVSATSNETVRMPVTEVNAFAGSGQGQAVGGHLHAVFDKNYGLLRDFFMGGQDYRHNSRHEAARQGERIVKDLLSLLILPVFLSEEKSPAPVRRRETGYGQLYSFRGNYDRPCHLEWRMPFSHLGSPTVCRGLVGLWAYWCDLFQNIHNKKIDLESVLTEIKPFVECAVGLDAKVTSNDYLRNYSYSGETAFRRHVQLQDEVYDVFKNNRQIYRKIAPQLYTKHMTSFSIWFRHILNQKVVVDNDMIPAWYDSTWTRRQPAKKVHCAECKRTVRVEDIGIYKSRQVCTRCIPQHTFANVVEIA